MCVPREGHARVVGLAGGSRVLELAASDLDGRRVGAGREGRGGQRGGDRGGQQGAARPAGDCEWTLE